MSYISKIEDIDNFQKFIYRLQETCDRAFIAATMLDDKVEMKRLHKELSTIDRIFKLQRFRLEDAIKFANNTSRCNDCSTIIQSDTE